VARADFYLIGSARFAADPVLLVCGLARKAYRQELPTLILARTLEEAQGLDDRLWSFDPEEFLPHQIAGEEDDDLAPILIVPPGARVRSRPLVINLREECAEPGFEVVKEVVPANPEERAGSRRRWAEYRKRGLDVVKHDM
jgi:DNA polymerase-3 subunit chi